MKKFRYYMLTKDFEIVGTDSVQKWGVWFEEADRHLALTKIGEIEVSTVFLGLDHSFHEDVPPVLWETMIFVGESKKTLFDHYQERYSSFDDARAGHERAVAMVRQKSDARTQ